MTTACAGRLVIPASFAAPTARARLSDFQGLRILSLGTGLTSRRLCSGGTRRSLVSPCRPRVVCAAFDPSYLHAAAEFDPLQILSLASPVQRAAHSLLYTLADATGVDVAASAANAVNDAAGASAAVTEAAEGFVKKSDWLSWLSDGLEGILKLLENGLSMAHVPYAYGFSIILLTILVKAATYPLTKKQVESTMAMQNLQPKIKAIQTKYTGNQERIQLETARLYKDAGVNPLAGCLPTLATLPVWIGLYRALSNVASEGILTEGFFWIPSLAGPTSLANRTVGSGTSWLFPFMDGAPPLGWGDTVAYLVLPVLLVASQAVSMQLMQPPTTDPAQKQTQAILKFLPLMIGYFSLSVPSGLSLYWLTNNILSTAQTLYLRRDSAAPVVSTGGGGAPDIIDVGQAKRGVGGFVATDEEKERERLRGERFRARKEAEEAKRSAKRAAEEAARASQSQSEQTLAQQQSRQAVAEQQPLDGALEADDGEEEEAGEGSAIPLTAPLKAGSTIGNGAASAPKPKRTRSKRTRRV